MKISTTVEAVIALVMTMASAETIPDRIGDNAAITPKIRMNEERPGGW